MGQKRMPSFSSRTHGEEMMDDFSITDERLTGALHQLRGVNRWLGGTGATMRVLAPWLQARTETRLRILDVGTGLADIPVQVLRRATRQGYGVDMVGVDANPATVSYARRILDAELPPSLRPHLTVETGDALALPYPDDAFDVVMAAAFLHHFEFAQAVAVLMEMNRVARHGILINDLHRHPLAYYGILAIVNLLPVSPMFGHDGPVSVLRGFRRDELYALAEAAGLPAPTVRWHWAFRWTLSTL